MHFFRSECGQGRNGRFAAMAGHHGRHGGGRGPFGDGPMGGGGGGRGGRKRLFSNEALRLILLELLSQEPRHGYDLIREIESRSGEAYAPSPGVVYPTLTLLADMDLIVEQPGAGSRKLFAISDAGRAHLAENRAALEEAMELLTSLARRAEQVDGAPIRRAMHNLSIAVRARLEREGADRETMFDVASLIDEAASKIERL
ncbi:PadR family transcriptional regulator [Sphingobium sp. EP60837]|jgi:DNA-binding PadR family transcriptional regulator|nr:PadR family transcriptional regulator [Sphingobium sp. EP60837]ANI77376.1 Transcriptional regulator YqjI [Sphingobium sp. EP60837]